MEIANKKQLILTLKQDALDGVTAAASKFVLQDAMKTNLSVSASIANEDVTLKDQINDHSSIQLNVGENHAMLNYQLTF